MNRLNVLTRLLMVLGVGCLLTPRVVAHHSFAAEFDATKPIRLKGVLSGVSLVNPHGWIHVDVTDDAFNKLLDPPITGKKVTWSVETGGVNGLFRRGWRVKDLPVGKTVVVEGFMAKDGSPSMNGACVIFEDGRRLFAGSSAPNEAFVGTGLEGGQQCGPGDNGQ
jgi:hypothetical protein